MLSNLVDCVLTACGILFALTYKTKVLNQPDRKKWS